MLKILNLYAGLGGNRANWGISRNISVTAVENDYAIAKRYRELYPDDTVVMGDAHEVLLQCVGQAGYDFIWSSFPCPSHTRWNLVREPGEYIYPDLGLYQEILLLKAFAKCKWVVENVQPYYEPLIRGQQVSRHLFWANFYIPDITIEYPNQFENASEKQLGNWLGIDPGPDLFRGDKLSRRQVLRNCVHPVIGDHVLRYALKPLHQELFNQ